MLKHWVELVATRRDATEVPNTSKETFDFVSAFVKFLVITTKFTSVTLRRNDRFQADVASRLARFVALASASR